MTRTSDPIVSRQENGWVIDLPVTPVPAARPRVAKWGTYYPKSYEKFRKEADAALRPYQVDAPYDGPVILMVTFICSRPKNPSNPYPRGDIDNYEKAFYDAITKAQCVWKDDAQITHVDAAKRYAAAGETPCVTAVIKMKA